MPKITIPKDEALEILDSGKPVVVLDRIIGRSRWAVEHELVFRRDDKLYSTTYRVGATEMQDESPFEYEDNVECTEVVAYERQKIDYKPVE